MLCFGGTRIPLNILSRLNLNILFPTKVIHWNMWSTLSSLCSKWSLHQLWNTNFMLFTLCRELVGQCLALIVRFRDLVKLRGSFATMERWVTFFSWFEGGSIDLSQPKTTCQHIGKPINRSQLRACCKMFHQAFTLSSSFLAFGQARAMGWQQCWNWSAAYFSPSTAILSFHFVFGYPDGSERMYIGYTTYLGPKQGSPMRFVYWGLFRPHKGLCLDGNEHGLWSWVSVALNWWHHHQFRMPKGHNHES